MIRVVEPGLLSTVQDLGRFGYRKDGVSTSGAMDAVSHRIANLLVGNNEAAATLEITLVGPSLETDQDVLVAICGADLKPRISDVPVRGWRPIYMKQGSTLAFESASWGCRAYLAVGGGIDVPLVLGSRSTYLRAGMGGLCGRALREGDFLRTGEPGQHTRIRMGQTSARIGPLPFAMGDRAIDPMRLGPYNLDEPVRVTLGPHFDRFSSPDREALFGRSFTISQRSDRMGYRLSGPTLRSGSSYDILSQGVLQGTVQVPPSGELIILMADCQTIGGYPIVAQVISCDLPKLAQLRPGDNVNFEAVSVEKAQRELALQEERLQAMLREVVQHVSG